MGRWALFSLLWNAAVYFLALVLAVVAAVHDDWSQGAFWLLLVILLEVQDVRVLVRSPKRPFTQTINVQNSPEWDAMRAAARRNASGGL